MVWTPPLENLIAIGFLNNSGQDPLENHTDTCTSFLSKTGPDAQENHKASKPAFNVGPSSAHQRNPIKMAHFTRYASTFEIL